MKNNIRLDIIHPEKARAEHFLNNVDEDLQQIPFDARELGGVDDKDRSREFGYET